MSKTVVLGLGNLILCDEGFGVQAVAQLRDRFTFSDEVELVDGGTLGLSLLPVLEDADRLIVLDAAELNAPAGTLVLLGWDDLPRALRIKLSPHQETIEEAFALLELRKGRPDEFVAIGVQPGSLEMGVELTPPVAAALESAVARVVAILRSWGVRVQERALESGGRDPSGIRLPSLAEKPHPLAKQT